MQLPAKILVSRHNWMLAQLRLINRYNLPLVATLKANSGAAATQRCRWHQLNPGLFVYLLSTDLANMALLLFMLIKLVREFVGVSHADLIDRLAVDAIVTVSELAVVAVEMVSVGLDLEGLAALRPPCEVKIVIKEVLRHIVVTLIASVYSIGARALQAHFSSLYLNKQ